MTIREQLDQNIPREVITTRSQSGKSLSYLETWYVIDRLNQVLGTDNWSWEVRELRALPGEKMSFICTGMISAVIEGKHVYKTGLGYGSDKSNFNAGEMGSKEAESDALKRAAMKFGRSLGLALYDKTQEFVGEQQNVQVESKERKEAPKNTKAESSTSGVTGPDVNVPDKLDKQLNVAVLRSQIRAKYNILQDQKKISQSEFVAKFTKGIKVADLSDNQVVEVLNLLKTTYPELGS